MLGTLIRADPSLIPIDRPRCPKCEKRMVKVQHKDLRQFNCAGCGHVEFGLESCPRAVTQPSLDSPDEVTAFIVAKSMAQIAKPPSP